MSLFSLRPWRLAALALFAAAAAPPLCAQSAPPGPQTLAVPANVSWQHAETGMILPPAAAGLRRHHVHDATTEELDVSARYVDETGLVADIFLFKSMTPYAALWFDRSLTAILLRPGWGLEAAAPPAPVAFAPPGASATSGLRSALEVGVPDVRSTALAVVPVGANFLLKIRASSANLDRAQLDTLLSRFIADLRWPTPLPGHAAVPIASCERPLRLRRARIVAADGASTLMDAVLGAAAGRPDDRGPPTYCREPGASLQYGVYRPDASTERYVVALADAGIALAVGEAADFSALTGGQRGPRRYSMTLLERERSSVMPSFNRLPPPEQAMSVAFGSRGPTISVTTRDRD